MEKRDGHISGKIITSDDVFQKLLDTRGINQINNTHRSSVMDRKQEMMAEISLDPSKLRLHGLDDYERFKEYSDAVDCSTSKFIKDRCKQNLESRSNGETAMQYLTSEITDNSLYLLDEPENSLSPLFQNELKQFIEDSAHYFKCQFVVATHSPILLSLKNASIYNLDNECELSQWYELENIRQLAKLFKDNSDKFSDL